MSAMNSIGRIALCVAFAALSVFGLFAGGIEFELQIDTSDAPELAEWCEQELRPVVETWYAKFCEMYPSKGWKPPKLLRVRFMEKMKVPAYVSKPSNIINLNRGHFNKTKSLGCVIHELFHVVQQYRKTPKWIKEATADYARFYVYAKNPKACKVNKRKAKARSAYRTGANFLDFVERRHPGTFRKLNDVCRRGKYNEAGFWPKATGKDLDTLEKEWKSSK